MSLTLVGNDVPRVYDSGSDSPVILIEGRVENQREELFPVAQRIINSGKVLNIAGWFNPHRDTNHYWLTLSNSTWVRQVGAKLQVATRNMPVFTTPNTGWTCVTLNDDESKTDVWVNGSKVGSIPWTIPGTLDESWDLPSSLNESFAFTYLAPGSQALNIPFYQSDAVADNVIEAWHSIWLNALNTIPTRPTTIIDAQWRFDDPEKAQYLFYLL